MSKKNVYIILILVLFSAIPASAQCAMCRAVLENAEGQSAAAGINNGIVYLMAIPYILMAGIGIAIYRKFFYSKKA